MNALCSPGGLTLRKVFSSVWQHFFSAWLLLFLVQLLFAWGRWEVRDMTGGDTSYYYRDTINWLKTGHWALISNSPVYSLYLSTWMAWITDPFWVIQLHRLGIYFLEGAAVLFLFRRLLPSPLLAWLGALAWILNPNSLESLYEIHLLSLALVLLPLGFLALSSARWRAAGCALLLFFTLFLRNEYFLFLLFALLVIGREDWRRRLWKPYLAAFSLALVACAGLILLLGNGSLNTFLDQQQRKTYRQFGQGYAVYYVQVHPEWTENPFLSYQKINQQTFGVEKLGPVKALLLNPGAVLEFSCYNLKKIATGLDLLCFDRTSARRNPSGDPVSRPLALIWLPFTLLLGFAGLGLLHLLQSSPSHTKRAGLVFLAAIPLALLTTAIQRATPIYLLPLGPLIIYLAILGWIRLRQADPRVGAGAAIVLVLTLAWPAKPSFLAPKGEQFVGQMVKSLLPYRSSLQDPDFKIASLSYGEDSLRYLGARPNEELIPVLPTAAWSDPLLWKEYLQSTSANWLYLHPQLMLTALPAVLKEQSQEGSWELLSHDESGKNSWALFKRKNPQSPVALP